MEKISQKQEEDTNVQIPLVQLNIRNITYKPLTEAYGKSQNNILRIKKKKTDERIPRLKRKTVLKNVTPPAIEPYKLQGWLGPSGSGKTSLMSIAAGVVDVDSSDAFSEESEITINNDPTNMLKRKNSSSKKGSFPRGLAGVVWQDDLLLSNLTVRETIEFAAVLKTPRSEKHKIPGMVDKVLNDLSLTAVQDSLIGSAQGGPGRGISGGERKRVSVAQELVTRPPLIFLDEPTSGLDATSALELMVTLKKLAQSGGHSIVAVIHQPRTTIFSLLDGLLLLSQGEEIYSGPVDGARRVLESCPIIGSPLPDQTNVADWIMDTIRKDEDRGKIMSVETESNFPILDDEEAASETSSGRCLPRHWNATKLSMKSDDSTTQSSKHLFTSLVEIRNSMPRYTTPFSTQLRVLTRRSVKQNRGDRISVAAVINAMAYIAFETAFWFRLTDDTNHIYERNSLIFFFLIAQANGVVIGAVPTFRRDRALLSRERSKKMYRVSVLFIAKTFADVTTSILLPLLHAAIVYWTTNLRPEAGHFFMFCFLFYLTITAAQSMGQFISAILPSLQLALVITPTITIFIFIVGGFYIPFSNMSPEISWLKWLGFATYGYSGLLVNEYHGRQIPCAATVLVSVGASSEVCPLPGDDVLASLGITGLLSEVWFNITMLIVLQIIFRLWTYILLRKTA